MPLSIVTSNQNCSCAVCSSFIRINSLLALFVFLAVLLLCVCVYVLTPYVVW